MKRVCLITLGCKTNQSEGDRLARGLATLGYRVTDDEASPPDLAVVNTCTVTVRADRKCRQAIHRIARDHPGVPIYVTGCYVHRAAGELGALPGVAGTAADKEDLLRLIAAHDHAAVPQTLPGPGEVPGRRARAMLKIQDGCDAYCSYCIVPHVRPRLWSKPVAEVLDEGRALVAAGFREIVLTGIHLGRYGADRTDPASGARAVTLVEVVRRVAALDGLDRLRLSSIEMFDVADDLVDLVAESPVVCPHLHLPLQSGDDGVLRAMNRRYTVDDVLQTVGRIRKRIPDVSLTTDVIAGFPGESDGAFENTVRVCREAGFSRMHVFPFSARPGTLAADLPGRLTARVVTRRKKRLLTLADELALDYKQRFLGKTVEVLVERSAPDASGRLISEGLTPYYMRVHFAGATDRVNRIVPVTVECVTPGAMEARLND